MLRVCRICLSEIRYETTYYSLNMVEELTGFMPIRDKLTLCVPEMALDLVIDPLLCRTCKTTLQVAYDFKQMCLETEKKLHKVMKQTRIENGCVNLVEIIPFLRNKEEVVIKRVSDIKDEDEDYLHNEPPSKQEIVIDSYSELRNILERHPPTEDSPIKRVVININNAVEKVVETLSQQPITETTGSPSPAMEYVDNIRDTPDEELAILSTSTVGVEDDEDLTDDAISENFIPLIDVGRSKKDTVQTYMCKICTVKLPQKSNFKQHILNHKRSLNHICYVCNRKFKAIHYLKRHEKTHVNASANYKCLQCQKTFKDKCSFNKHSHDAMTGMLIKKNKNRNNLPKEAKRIMKKWLYDHQDNPYPTDTEKQELVVQTSLKYIQVENWFVNARRRILNKSREYFMSNDDST